MSIQKKIRKKFKSLRLRALAKYINICHFDREPLGLEEESYKFRACMTVIYILIEKTNKCFALSIN